MLGAGEIAGLVIGLMVAGAGFYMLRWGRTMPASGEDAERGPQGVLATMLGGLSLPTRYVIGFCLILLGYHAVAYSLPAGMLWLRVPPERLWIMGVAVAVVVTGSLVMDARERR